MPAESQDQKPNEGTAPADGSAPVGPHPLQRREAALEALQAARLADVTAESGGESSPAAATAGGDREDEGAPPAEPRPADQPPPAGDPESPQPPVQEPPARAEAPPAAAPDQFEVIVNGEKKLVTRDELIASYQKNDAADQKLRQASALLRDAERLAKPADGDTGSKPTQTPIPPGTPDGVDWDGLARSLQYDTPEEAGKRLKEALSGRATTPDRDAPDPDAIVQAAVDRIEMQTAAADFGRNYADLTNDPQLRYLTEQYAASVWNAYLEDVKANGPKPRPPYYKVLEVAGNHVRSWRDGLTQSAGNGATPPGGSNPNPQPPQPSAAPVVRLDDRRTQDKRTSAQPPAARTLPSSRPAAAAAPQDPEQQIEASRRSALDELTKSRNRMPAAS